MSRENLDALKYTYANFRQVQASGRFHHRAESSRDGPETGASYFRSGVIAGTSTLMTVPVQAEGAFTAGSPRPLFRFRYEQGGHDYAVMPDGQHFICIKESERESSATQMNVVLNWNAELQKE